MPSPTIRRWIANILTIIGVIPGIVWLGYVAYLFWLGPQEGWSSDHFFGLEGQSLIWWGGAVVGVLLAGIANVKVRP